MDNKDKEMLEENFELEDFAMIDLVGEDGETIHAMEVDRFVAEDNTYVIFTAINQDCEGGCDCDCEDECGEDEAFLLKVVFNAEGEEVEYVEPTEEEFEVAQKVYDQLCDESDLDEEE